MQQTNSSTVPICGHCGRPIGGPAVWLGSQMYHPECTQSPYKREPDYRLSPPLAPPPRQQRYEKP